MRNWFRCVVLYCCLGGLGQVWVLADQKKAPERESNGVAVIVDDKVVTIDDIKHEAGPLARQLRAEYPSDEEFKPKLRALVMQTLQNKIDRILIVKSFNKIGGIIQKTLIDAQYDEFIKSNFNGNQRAFHAYLKSEGKTRQQFYKEIEEREVVNFMHDRVKRSQTEVSPQSIADFYKKNQERFQEDESVQVEQIMFKGELTSDKTQKTLAAIEGELKKKSFAEVACAYSEDAEKKPTGALPWIHRNQLRAELSAVAFSLKKGESSAPVASGGYIFLFHLVDRRPGGAKPLEAVRGEVEQLLSERASQENYQKWLEQLRKNAYIKQFDFDVE